MNALELSSVELWQGDRRTLYVPTLTVPAGQCIGVVGPALGGKTLLAKLACGLVRSDGKVTTLGQAWHMLTPIAAAALRQRMGMQFQNYALFDGQTVLANVMFPLLRRPGAPAYAEAHAKASAALRAVGLAGSETKLPAQLSGGMRKRVSLARAVVTAPEFVIYDEPTAGLDPVTSQKIYDLIVRDQAARGCTAMIIASDVPALLRLATYLIFIADGMIGYAGPTPTPQAPLSDAVRGFLFPTETMP